MTKTVRIGAANAEGSVSNERIENVVASNISWQVTTSYGTNTVNNGFEMDQVSIPGDSGGSIVLPSGYGPLGVGSIIATNSTHSFGQNLSTLLYLDSVQLNITTNATYCNNA